MNLNMNAAEGLDGGTRGAREGQRGKEQVEQWGLGGGAGMEGKKRG